MKLTYFYLRSKDGTAEYQATSLIQLINNAETWPNTDKDRLAILADFVAHHALFSTLHANKWDGFAESCAAVLGLFITRIVSDKQVALTQFHASRVAKQPVTTK